MEVRPALIVILALLGGVFFYTMSHQTNGATLPSNTESELGLQSVPPPATSTQSLHIPILIYHSVHPTHPKETKEQIAFNVPPDMFEQQLKYLRDNGYTTISMQELRYDLQRGTTTPVTRPVVITFDDGWQNQYTRAFPLLKQYGDTATFYIYTNPIGKDDRFLTWDEVIYMSAAGMTIGSHTLSHPYLSKLTPEQLHKEITQSKKIIEEHIGIPVQDFASPFGYSSPAVIKEVRDAGYLTGRTTYRGAWHESKDLLSLRGYFAPQTMEQFEWILTKAQ